MWTPYKILRLIFALAIVLTAVTCAPAKKNPYFEKKKKSSIVSGSQLGKNRYFFSNGYQKKLNKKFKR